MPLLVCGTYHALADSCVGHTMPLLVRGTYHALAEQEEDLGVVSLLGGCVFRSDTQQATGRRVVPLLHVNLL